MAQKPTQQIRIIGGQWKRTPLRVVDAPGLRPTPDRVRETLFNWLGQQLDGLVCLDLFAGSGALGFEAASRGAAQVLMNEPERVAAQAIRQTIEKLAATQIQCLQYDALVLLKQLQQQGKHFDVLFLDPPFAQNWLEKVLPYLPSVLKQGAHVYVEAEAACQLPQEFILLRQDKAGAVHYHLYQYEPQRGNL